MRMAQGLVQFQDILEYRQERVLFSTDFNLFKRRTEKINVSLSVYDSAVKCIEEVECGKSTPQNYSSELRNTICPIDKKNNADVTIRTNTLSSPTTSMLTVVLIILFHNAQFECLRHKDTKNIDYFVFLYEEILAKEIKLNVKQTL